MGIGAMKWAEGEGELAAPGSQALENPNLPVVLNTTQHLWFQACTMLLMRYALFWGIMQRQMVILYRHFGTTYQSQNVSRQLQFDAAYTPERSHHTTYLYYVMLSLCRTPNIINWNFPMPYSYNFCKNK
jgi:hypothetical protein